MKLTKIESKYVLTEEELVKLYKEIYSLGFTNGTMSEVGLERNEMDDNLRWFLAYQKKD